MLSLFAVTPAAFAGMEKAIYIAPVPDNPLTAVVMVDQARTRPDGSKASVMVQEDIARDAQGRMYRGRWSVDAGTNKPTALIFVELFDPATSTYTIMYPGSKTYWVGKLSHQADIQGDGFFYGPNDDGAPSGHLERGQDVGVQEMQGVSVHHVREIDPIKTNTSQVVVTREYWYSDDLHMSLAANLDDPRAVKQTSTVTELARTEPDAGIYAVPAAYRQVADWSQLQGGIAKLDGQDLPR
jgi:hypothetical protein